MRKTALLHIFHNDFGFPFVAAQSDEASGRSFVPFAPIVFEVSLADLEPVLWKAHAETV